MSKQLCYTINYTDGSKDSGYETHTAAERAFCAKYPDGVVGHDGDLGSGGDRTLCWANESDSVDDDGAKAAASITLVEITLGVPVDYSID